MSPPAVHRRHDQQTDGLLHGRTPRGRGAGEGLRQQDRADRGPRPGAQELPGSARQRMRAQSVLHLPERDLLRVHARTRSRYSRRQGPRVTQVGPVRCEARNRKIRKVDLSKNDLIGWACALDM